MEYILDKAIEYYKSMEFKSCCENIPTHLIECCCHGLPIDPEYFILQDMIKAKEENEKLEIERDLALIRYTISSGSCSEYVDNDGIVRHDANRCNHCLLYAKQSELAIRLKDIQETNKG